VRTCLTLVTAAILLVTAAPAAQSDLDALMARVLARRDDNWTKLQQYTLVEENTFRLLGPLRTPLYGSRRTYQWFPREGFFIRSPVDADGVTIGDAARAAAEQAFLEQERRRERRRTGRGGDGRDAPDGPGNPDDPEDIPDVIRQTVEPEFVSAAYFLRFRFERGHYALVGREQLLGRDVLRIEYYPQNLFRTRRGRGRGASGGDGPGRPTREEEARITEQMNDVSLVTLWVEPEARQILQYEFENVDADFLPGRWLARLDAFTASMRMTNPFPDVWLPASLHVRVDLSLAVGDVSASYDVAYRDYRLAETAIRILP
jgi:hypothetical protein